MSSTNKTPNLNMHSWVRTDPVVCEDFNDNFNKLDEAVGSLKVTRGNCEIFSGDYTGTGSKTCVLTFPKRPVYLIIQKDKSNNQTYHGFVVDGAYFFAHSTGDYYNKIYISGTTVTLQETGSGNAVTLNVSGMTYHYMAFAPAE